MKISFFISPRDKSAVVDPPYYPMFGFCWWFWVPTFYHQKPVKCGNYYNARELRLIFLCIAVNLQIGREGV